MDNNIIEFPKSAIKREITEPQDTSPESLAQLRNVAGLFSGKPEDYPSKEEIAQEINDELELFLAEKEFVDTVFTTVAQTVMDLILSSGYTIEENSRLMYEITLLLTAMKASIYRNSGMPHSFEKVVDTVEGMTNYTIENYIRDSAHLYRSDDD